MTNEELHRFEVLLENIQTSVKVIAEGHGALVARFDRMDVRFDKLETRFDRLEMRFDRLETTVTGLEVFAGDAQRRLKRIETHLQLNGSSSSSLRRKAARTPPPKRHKKS